MGAPKQKWTAEEEAALKAGVRKHGTGKWRTILSDPEFSAILHSRSNVDLKVKIDFWREFPIFTERKCTFICFFFRIRVLEFISFSSTFAYCILINQKQSLA